MGWQRVTYLAATADGGTKKTTVILKDPTTRPSDKMPGTVVISGREVDRDGDVTDRIQVIIATEDEVQRVDLVQDLVYDRLVTPARESAESRAMRARP
jgi:hypothetical protein